MSNKSSSSSAPFWKLTNGKNGEKYLIFPTRRNNYNTLIDNNSDNNLNPNNNTNDNIEIKTYKLRWFILIVICLINISNAINWICYSAIADFTGKFYNVDYNKVNFLSLVYLIVTVPTGFISFIIIDYFGVRSSLNIAGWLNFIGSFLRVLSSIDNSDGTSLIQLDYKYLMLMSGQVLCSLAQPFVMFVTTKFANAWFTENQRALANTVALSSNTFGILIGAFISPLIVKSEQTYEYEMSILNYITCGSSLVPAVLAAFITRSSPPTPPSYSAIQALQNNNTNNLNTDNININADNTQIQMTFRENIRLYFEQIGKLMKSTYFLLLLVSFGLGLGLFNSLTTLLQQILCVHGYTDDDVGIFGGIMIFSGILGSLVCGIIVDKTKRFEEVAKVCFCMSCIANIFFTIIQNYNNDNGLIKYLIIVAFCLIGIFGLPLLPVCMEMSVECVYPIPEATTTGLLFIGGQIVGIAMILAYPKIGSTVPTDSYIYTDIQKCITANSTSITSSLSVVDYKYPLYGQTILFVLIAIIFTIFFKCPYLRLRTERERLAEQILNSSRQPNIS